MLGRYTIKPKTPYGIGQLVQETPYQPMYQILDIDTVPAPEGFIPYKLPEPEAAPDVVDAVDALIVPEDVKAGIFTIPENWKKILLFAGIGVGGYFLVKALLPGMMVGAAKKITKKPVKKLKKAAKKEKKKIKKKIKKSVEKAKKGLRKMLANPELLIVNPYGPGAKYFHLRVRDPKKFQKKHIRTIDPGTPGKVKVTIGRPKGSRKTTAQAVLVEKKMVPKRLHGYFKGLEERLEDKPAKTSYALAKRIAKKTPAIAGHISKAAKRAVMRASA